MQINVLDALTKGPHEGRGPDGIDGTIRVHIVVLPGFFEFFLHELSFLVSSETKMGLDNFFGKLFGLVFHDKELVVWLSIFSHTFCCKVFNNVSSESINMLIILITDKVAWNLSRVAVHPLSSIVVISNKAIMRSMESLPGA